MVCFSEGACFQQHPKTEIKDGTYGVTGKKVCGIAAALLSALLFFAAVFAESSGWEALQGAISQAEAGDVVALSDDVTAHDGDSIITISAWREDGCHVIEIRDNGTGFDPEAKKKPGETHIGIENVRTRLEQQCGGTLNIESAIGKGTCVTLRTRLKMPDVERGRCYESTLCG